MLKLFISEISMNFLMEFSKDELNIPDIPEGCVAVVKYVDGAELEAGDALPVAQVPAVPAQHLHKSWEIIFRIFSIYIKSGSPKIYLSSGARRGSNIACLLETF